MIMDETQILKGLEPKLIIGNNDNYYSQQPKENQLEREFRKAKIDKVNEDYESVSKAISEQYETLEKLNKEIEDKHGSVEIMPLTSYLLVEPFKFNPFQKIEKDNTSGLILSSNLDLGQKSQETGEHEFNQQYIKVGTVVESGTECKFVKPGDMVIYNVASENMLAFYDTNFVVVNEQRILAVVNDKLTDRKKEIINGRSK
jgi:hypothetical protein|nr:MAG TPA: mHsp60, mHsp10, Mitochondrial, Chaperonin, Complex, Symmetric [Caudoviricetes sp.]